MRLEIGSKESVKKKVVLVIVLCMIMTMSSTALAAGNTATTQTLFDTVEKLVGEIFNELVTISTVIAALGCAIALFIRLLSRNTRSIEEANSWLKRIIISWLVLNSLAFFVAYGRNITEQLSSGYDPIYSSGN